MIGINKRALSRRDIEVCSRTPRRRSSRVKMLGPPIETGREVQQLRSRAREATLAGQVAKPLRHFPKMGAVQRRTATLRPAGGHQFSRPIERHGAELAQNDTAEGV